ncbi:MAG: hypothetical protein ACOYLB_01505 [Phototrophicaceae bacterium]
MPIQIVSLSPLPIIVIRMVDSIVLQDIANIIQYNTETMQQSPRLIHVIYDCRELKKIDFALRDIGMFRKTPIDPNSGWSLIVTDHPFFVFMGSTIAQLISNVRFRVIPSALHALTFIQNMEGDTQDLTLEMIEGHYSSLGE